ncbi:inorganic phosphate transporter [Desulfolutivibrio sulfoxidireducens]|uniref:inorganic phosphate transporter n=1 Tax=Desulfolutivibrio sulfoxidireducens TaxID=2773299 RepID=UPI00159D34BA|nr:inorganic phosphate transporter [Desulfolutivibrio sulfoxidireducens]QLA15434.1 inorganic phosphate transporter [Desulfolutivibrio sulfoxidireducens]QLA19034.1 inorganic phosphate transporter [Desulfolutivibrio sulfoxidireducens]
MPDIPLLLVAVVGIALIFDFTNGAHDSANAIATVVSTKVLSPLAAVTMAAILNLAGALLGTAVAHTIGSGIVSPELVAGSQGLVLSALFGAIVWNCLTWYLGLPSSSSHALIGGLIGASIAHGGFGAPNYPSILEKIVLPLVFSPLAGFLCGYLFMVVLSWLLVRASPTKVNHVFKKLQIASSAFMATSHGLNDAQKTMGIITLALFTFHQIPEMTVPLWVKLSCALAMGLGTATGGWKIVKTMGHKIFKLEPVHGFAAETAAALVITGASSFGAPISTTHTISTAVIGVGASKRLSAVRWGVCGNLVLAWILTIPAAALAGALCYEILALFGVS